MKFALIVLTTMILAPKVMAANCKEVVTNVVYNSEGEVRLR